MSDQGRELGWDDEIQNDGDEKIILPPGEYPYTVLLCERARHNGSDKLPPCPVAKLSIKIDGGNLGSVVKSHRLFLHTKTEGLVCQFFRSIGARKHGERLRMNWNSVGNSRGRCKTFIREFEGKKYTEIKSFLDPVPEPTTAPEQEQKKGWSAGTF